MREAGAGQAPLFPPPAHSKPPPPPPPPTHTHTHTTTTTTRTRTRTSLLSHTPSARQVGVLTRSVLDDGRGSARARVFKHSHEADTGGWVGEGREGILPAGRAGWSPQRTTQSHTSHTSLTSTVAQRLPLSSRATHHPPTAARCSCPSPTGRTSSVGQHTLCLDSRGAILNDAAFRWGEAAGRAHSEACVLGSALPVSCAVAFVVPVCEDERGSPCLPARLPAFSVRPLAIAGMLAHAPHPLVCLPPSATPSRRAGPSPLPTMWRAQPRW